MKNGGRRHESEEEVGSRAIVMTFRVPDVASLEALRVAAGLAVEVGAFYQEPSHHRCVEVTR